MSQSTEEVPTETNIMSIGNPPEWLGKNVAPFTSRFIDLIRGNSDEDSLSEFPVQRGLLEEKLKQESGISIFNLVPSSYGDEIPLNPDESIDSFDIAAQLILIGYEVNRSNLLTGPGRFHRLANILTLNMMHQEIYDKTQKFETCLGSTKRFMFIGIHQYAKNLRRSRAFLSFPLE